MVFFIILSAALDTGGRGVNEIYFPISWLEPGFKEPVWVFIKILEPFGNILQTQIPNEVGKVYKNIVGLMF